MDNLVSVERSRNMSAIKSKNTTPELIVRKALFERGFRYRLHSKAVPGHPDIWMKKYNTAIFVNGCFWHRHNGCKYAYMPKTRVRFWEDKFRRNMERDIIVHDTLREKGIRCITVWECTINKVKKDPKRFAELIDRIEEFLLSDEEYAEL